MVKNYEFVNLNHFNNFKQSYLVIKKAVSDYHVSIAVQVNEFGHINLYNHEISVFEDAISIKKPQEHIFSKESLIKTENGYDIFSNEDFYLYYKLS